MIKMGKVYEEEGNLEAAYVLYLKYITLFFERIKTHRCLDIAKYFTVQWVLIP